jgi:hypothetical protein
MFHRQETVVLFLPGIVKPVFEHIVPESVRISTLTPETERAPVFSMTALRVISFPIFGSGVESFDATNVISAETTPAIRTKIAAKTTVIKIFRLFFNILRFFRYIIITY